MHSPLPARFLIAIVALVFPELLVPQTLIKSRPSENPQESVAFAQREYLNPVLKSLRRTAANDSELNNLLDELQIWARSEPRPDEGPNASADTTSGGKPVIYVDVALLEQFADVANLAGYALLGTGNYDSTIGYRIGSDYRVNCQKAIQNGLSPPPFVFHAEKYVSGPDLAVVPLLGNECFLSAITWSILHEVGHHRLGHVQRGPPSSFEEAREQELNADNWAFRKMVNLGYSLAPVRNMLGALQAAQGMRIALGLEFVDSESDHPTWEYRREQLEAHYDVNRPSSGPFAVYCFVVEAGPNQWETSELCVPLASAESEGLFLAVWQNSGGETGFAPFERVNGTIHLYLRNEVKSQEIIIQNPGKLIVDVTGREIGLVDRSESKIKSRAIQLDYQFFFDPDMVLFDSVTLRDLTEFSPLKMIIQPLRTIENRPEIVELAKRILRDGLMQGKKVILKYSRGEFSYDTANEQYQTNWMTVNKRLCALLGSDAYNEFRDKFLASRYMQLLLEKGPPLISGAGVFQSMQRGKSGQ